MIYVKKLKEQENAKIIISLLLKKMTLHCTRVRFTYYMYFIYMTVPFLDGSAIKHSRLSYYHSVDHFADHFFFHKEKINLTK